MRLLLLTCLALTATGCAGGDHPPMRHGPGGFRGDRPDRGVEGGGARGRLFVSPMGEPFRNNGGGADPEDVWFAQADTNHDGVLTLAEFSADATRFFAVLDRRHDGEIDPDDVDYYESELLPEVRVGGGGSFGGGARSSRGSGSGGGGRRGGGGGGGRRGGGSGGGGPGGGGGQSGGGGPGGGSGGEGEGASTAPQIDDSKLGAARYGFFDYPEPITPADINMNRGIDPREFQAAAEKRFIMLDKQGTGGLRLKDLPRVSQPSFNRPLGEGPRPMRDRQRPQRDEDE